MAEQMPMAKTLYGKRKLSKAAYAKQLDQKTRSGREGTVYGSRKGGKPAPVVATESPGAPPPTTPPVTEEMKERLRNPEVPPRQQGAAEGADQSRRNPFEPTGDENGSGYVTLSELAEVLEKRPQLLDAAIEAEYRDGNPRKGAIELFLDIEANRKDGPRGEVIDRLTTPVEDTEE